MSQLLNKMNYKTGEIALVNDPLELWNSFAKAADICGTKITPNTQFALIFLKTEKEVKEAALQLVKVKAADSIVWFAYPKQSSKKHGSEISRDHGWKPLEKLGYQGVAMVAIDEDWAAFRFRKKKRS